MASVIVDSVNVIKTSMVKTVDVQQRKICVQQMME